MMLAVSLIGNLDRSGRKNEAVKELRFLVREELLVLFAILDGELAWIPIGRPRERPQSAVLGGLENGVRLEAQLDQQRRQGTDLCLCGRIELLIVRDNSTVKDPFADHQTSSPRSSRRAHIIAPPKVLPECPASASRASN